MLTFCFELARRFEFNIAFSDTGEDGLESEVVFLADRIKLVVMAAGAVRGSACEGSHGLGHDVVAVQVVKSVFGGSSAAELERAGRDEAKACGELWFIRVKDVGRELLTNKIAPGNISIKAIDDIIAEPPGVWTFLVVLTTV